MTGAADSTTGNGHNYFRQRPWVSSDLLALLVYDMDADERGLEKAADLPVWSFPPDYIDKIVVVDGDIAFVGGHDVGDEYVSRTNRKMPW